MQFLSSRIGSNSLSIGSIQKISNCSTLKINSKGTKSIVVDFHGRYDDNFSFAFGDYATTLGACPVHFKGEFYLFGGQPVNIGGSIHNWDHQVKYQIFFSLQSYPDN